MEPSSDYLKWELLFQECKDAPLTIWEQPEVGQEYVIGVDSSTGLSEDFTAAEVYTRSLPFTQVAELRVKWSVIDSAEMVAMLGHYYNTAFMIVETNYPGNAIQDALIQQYRYPKNYQTEKRMDENMTVSSRFGFQTTQASKWMLIRELQTSLKQKDIVIRSEMSIEELGNFIYIEDKTRTGAASGFNDDTVIANMLANHACLLYPTKQKPNKIVLKDPHAARVRRECKELIESLVSQEGHFEVL